MLTLLLITDDVAANRISSLDRLGNAGAHKLAVQAAKNRLPDARVFQALVEHDRLALVAHRCMIAVVTARSAESVKMGIFVPARHRQSDEHDGYASEGSVADELPAPAAPKTNAARSRARRGSAAQALAGNDPAPTHSPEGLPLGKDGRFLHVVSKKSGTFAARITIKGKTSNLGVFPSPKAAALAVQEFKKTGCIVKPTKAEAASVAGARVLARRVDNHNAEATKAGKHVFVLDSKLLTCQHCNAEFSSNSFSRACALICPKLGPLVGLKVDKQGSHTRAITLKLTRENAFIEHLREHNSQACRHGWHVMSTDAARLSQPLCTVCRKSVSRSYARVWMRRPCPGP